MDDKDILAALSAKYGYQINLDMLDASLSEHLTSDTCTINTPSPVTIEYMKRNGGAYGPIRPVYIGDKLVQMTMHSPKIIQEIKIGNDLFIKFSRNGHIEDGFSIRISRNFDIVIDTILRLYDNDCDLSDYTYIFQDMVSNDDCVIDVHIKDREIHRDGGLPAIITPLGEAYFTKGLLHREGDLPAKNFNGVLEYFIFGRGHRIVGPAYESTNLRRYIRHGRLHREDGPAVEDLCNPEGSMFYWAGWRFELDDFINYAKAHCQMSNELEVELRLKYS